MMGAIGCGTWTGRRRGMGEGQFRNAGRSRWVSTGEVTTMLSPQRHRCQQVLRRDVGRTVRPSSRRDYDTLGRGCAFAVALPRVTP